MHYRTEIEIAADRYVCLQLPDFIPPGRAAVTVRMIQSDNRDEPHAEPEPDDRGRDVEWWDEFDEDESRFA